jgi:hypothetical protein
MPCYTRAAVAVVIAAVAAVAAWAHVPAAVPPGLIVLAACTATLALLGWTARVIRRGRAGAGACTRCALSCQRPLIPPEQAGGPLPWPQRAGTAGEKARA